MGLSRTISKIESDDCKISHPRIFNDPIEGVSFGILYGCRKKRYEIGT